MQNKFINLINEAVNINTGLLSKSMQQSFETGQSFAQQVSTQVVDWTGIKNFDDYVVKQNSWNAFVVEQAQKSAQSAIDFGNEAYAAYLGLWNKTITPAAPTSETKRVKAA